MTKRDNSLLARLERHKSEVEARALIQEAIDEINELRGRLAYIHSQTKPTARRASQSLNIIACMKFDDGIRHDPRCDGSCQERRAEGKA